MPVIKNLWISENQKYKVLARRFEEGTVDMGLWKINKYGKNSDVRKEDLPVYVLDQMRSMRKEVKKQ